jgi:transposase-like protein
MQENDPVETLFKRANDHRVPMALICDRAGVARSTPSRWRQQHNGANLSTVNSLFASLDAIIAERTQQEAA